jgi:hypothetical protein
MGKIPLYVHPSIRKCTMHNYLGWTGFTKGKGDLKTKTLPLPPISCVVTRVEESEGGIPRNNKRILNRIISNNEYFPIQIFQPRGWYESVLVSVVRLWGGRGGKEVNRSRTLRTRLVVG